MQSLLLTFAGDAWGFRLLDQEWSDALDAERPRGPIPLKATGRSFTLDDADTTADEAEPIDDDFATSKPKDDTEEEKS